MGHQIMGASKSAQAASLTVAIFIKRSVLCVLFCLGAFPAALAQDQKNADPGRENHGYLTKSIVAAIACENGGHHIRYADLRRAFLNIPG